MKSTDYFNKEVRTVLYVKDLNKSRIFYRDILELPVIYTWDDGPQDQGLHFQAASGIIEILNRAPVLDQGPTTIMLEADNVDNCYQRLMQKNSIQVFEHLADRPYGIRMFQLVDPDGNVIVIFSWIRDVLEYRQSWSPRVKGFFRGEYRAVAYVDLENYEECLFFYRDILGLHACYTWDYGRNDRGYKFVIGTGGSTLEVLCRKDPMPQGAQTLMFEATDVDACYSSIMHKARDVVCVLEPPSDRSYGIRAFRLMDPNKNDIVIFSRLTSPEKEEKCL